MNTFAAVMLVVIIVNGDGKQTVREEPMPDMDACVMELGKFLRHQFPDSIGAKELKAGCRGMITPERPS